MRRERSLQRRPGQVTVYLHNEETDHWFWRKLQENDRIKQSDLGGAAIDEYRKLAEAFDLDLNLRIKFPPEVRAIIEKCLAKARRGSRV